MRRLKKCTSVFCIKQLEHKNSPAVEVELKRKIRYKHEQFVNKNRFKLTINENGKRGERREREREKERAREKERERERERKKERERERERERLRIRITKLYVAIKYINTYEFVSEINNVDEFTSFHNECVMVYTKHVIVEIAIVLVLHDFAFEQIICTALVWNRKYTYWWIRFLYAIVCVV